MSIFTELAVLAKRTKDLKTFDSATRIIKEASKRGAEITHIRKVRQIHRDKLERDGSRNGALITGEMHQLEYEAIRLLCPALQHPNGEDRDKTWQWILKQDWGKDFAAAPFEKTRF